MNIVLDDISCINGVYYLSAKTHDEFERAYTWIRKNEKRLYDDEVVETLPYISPHHIHHHEWKLRQATFIRLKRYFQAQAVHSGSLDIGCGNGWFTHHLHKWVKEPVFGVDINPLELEQAARLFQQSDCRFVYADIFKADFPQNHFDLICLNSVIQYFPSIDQLLKRLLTFLRDGGEIHIVDSPVYREKEVNAARQRTSHYYEKMGMPEMTEHYFHHSWKAFDGYPYVRMYPKSPFVNQLRSKFIQKQNPFPWLRIRKK